MMRRSTVLREKIPMETRDSRPFLICGLCFAMLLLGSAAQPHVSARSLDPEERVQLSNVLWWLGSPVNVVLAGLLLANVTGDASPGPIVLAIMWQLVLAAVLFMRLLLAPNRRSAA